MESLTYGTMEATWDRVREFVERFLSAEPHPIAQLTKGRVAKILGGELGGLYMFAKRAGDVPVYVGRSANLPQRLGLNHRSTNENQATVTKALMKKYALPNMSAARKLFYADHVVRIMTEPDVVTRALAEVYCAARLDTEFNSFMEH